VYFDILEEALIILEALCITKDGWVGK